ncbi:MAG: hypothetical protein WBC88_11795, partial [Candidatus Zixiibacteriota bacterium]
KNKSETIDKNFGSIRCCIIRFSSFVSTSALVLDAGVILRKKEWILSVNQVQKRPGSLKLSYRLACCIQYTGFVTFVKCLTPPPGIQHANRRDSV